MSKLRVLDLFSGIGGFSLGLERTGGFETVAFCEIEKFPRRVLAKHWPKVPCYDDVRTLTAERLAADGITVDVICGGFPCQDVSIIGLNAGIEGSRTGLFREILRLVRDILPRHIILENVTGLLDRGLGDVLCGLAAIGYDAEWHCIPAGSGGAPIFRDRVWIVAQPAQVGSEENQPLWRSITAELEAVQRTWIDLGGHALAVGHSWERDVHDARMGDGIPSAPHRIGALGNAVVPQIPELIGRAILASQEQAA